MLLLVLIGFGSTCLEFEAVSREAFDIHAEWLSVGKVAYLFDFKEGGCHTLFSGKPAPRLPA